jgi:hypothetical protein
MAANANLAAAVLVAALLTAQGAAAAQTAGPSNLPQVRASLEREGSQATVRRLMATGEWKAVLDGMGRAEPGWIAIAPLLSTYADGAFAEGFGISLARALPKRPAAVLNVLDRSDGHVIGASRVCSAPFIEPKPGFVAAYRKQAVAAVSAVHVASLEAARDACLAALQKRQGPDSIGSAELSGSQLKNPVIPAAA